MNGIVWLILGGLMIAGTKYATSLRLRLLTEKMQKESQDTQELRTVLHQVTDKEGQLKEEIEILQAKVSALRNVVGILERTLQKGHQTTAPSTESV